jgi:hypothetical protein
VSKLSWKATKRLVHKRADGCCEYCRSCERITSQPMTVDHIDPNGSDDPDNLCLACSHCNQSKFTAMKAIDPEGGASVRLFNPRLDQWDEHFEWIDLGIHMVGKTAIGRATIQRLKLNHERFILARKLWIIAGVHPPKSLS